LKAKEDSDEYEEVDVSGEIDNSLYPNKGFRKSARFKFDDWLFLLNCK
jgi:hypothetical protein